MVYDLIQELIVYGIHNKLITECSSKSTDGYF